MALPEVTEPTFCMNGICCRHSAGSNPEQPGMNDVSIWSCGPYATAESFHYNWLQHPWTTTHCNGCLGKPPFVSGCLIWFFNFFLTWISLGSNLRVARVALAVAWQAPSTSFGCGALFQSLARVRGIVMTFGDAPSDSLWQSSSTWGYHVSSSRNAGWTWLNHADNLRGDLWIPDRCYCTILYNNIMPAQHMKAPEQAREDTSPAKIYIYSNI